MTADRPTRPKLRAALAAFPERYVLPSRPSAAPPAALDAYRQTQFLLGGDVAVFEQAMNLQLDAVAANARARSPEAAALLTFWSRVFSHLADACTLLAGGAYVSCPPLLRSACDCIAAQRSLAADFSEYRQWFEGAISQQREHAALAFDLGRFRAGSVLAGDERLGGIYRLLTDLSMPHFGSTALQVASDSSLQKLALAFADNAFHLGWAELITGWLLTLAEAQFETVASSGVFAIPDSVRAQHQGIARDTASALGSRRRCYVEDIDGRFLFHNFRRSASGAPKRVML